MAGVWCVWVGEIRETRPGSVVHGARHACTHACMHVCIHACMHACMCAYMPTIGETHMSCVMQRGREGITHRGEHASADGEARDARVVQRP